MVRGRYSCPRPSSHCPRVTDHCTWGTTWRPYALRRPATILHCPSPSRNAPLEALRSRRCRLRQCGIELASADGFSPLLIVHRWKVAVLVRLKPCETGPFLSGGLACGHSFGNASPHFCPATGSPVQARML
jgi:hypothetical protein